MRGRRTGYQYDGRTRICKIRNGRFAAGSRKRHTDLTKQPFASDMWKSGHILRVDPDFWQRRRVVYPWSRFHRVTHLSDNEKIEIRRHCGYPAYGNSASGFSSWRYYQANGLLEYRIANLSDGEIVVARRYLTSLGALEAAIPGSSDNLDTAQAAIWARNANEVQDRERLYDGWCRRLCSFLGLPPGAGLKRGTGTVIV